MTVRTRAITLAVICVLALAVAVGYIEHSRAAQRRASRDAPPVARLSLAAAEAGPHLVFRSTALGTTYGKVAVVPLSKPRGGRAVTGTTCDRVFAAARKVICLAMHAGVVNTYSAHVLTPRMTRLSSLPLAGIPSRARLSPDARFASTTSFVNGDSYAGTSFSTRTVISDLGTSSSVDLENYALIHNGHRIDPIDRNFWGVTFAADDNTFYATAAWSTHTWLVRGSISARTVTTLHEDAECPSLSPDGRHIVFKQRGSLPPGRWRLVEYDVASGTTVRLAETRSVDDQVAWLDNSHVMYGLARSGTEQAVDDVWEVPANGTGHPRVLIPEAWSPSLVH